MIYCQGCMYGWQECELTCNDCNYTMPGLYMREMDTGQLYYSDNTQDKLDSPCPECGGKMEDK